MSATIHKLPRSKIHPNNLEMAKRARYYQHNDADPDLTAICDLVLQSGLTSYQIVAHVRELHGTVGHSTIDRWLEGKVRRPQNLTISWVGFALGYERKWTQI
jgi:IS30 family transposase